MKKTLVAVCALVSLFASGAASWKNLDDKAHVCGEKLTADDLLGKVVLVYYWDLSEEKSIKYIPEVEKVWDSFKTKKFVVVGNYIGSRDDAKIKAAAEKNKLSVPVYCNFTLDPDPKPGFGKAPYFVAVSHRGTALYTGSSAKEATEKVVEAINAIGMPVSLCQDVELKKFKGLAAQLKLGKNISNTVKMLEKKKGDKDPNVASEAQEILSAIDRAKEDVKADIDIYKEVDPAESMKIVQMFMKTWPKDEAVAGYKEQMHDLKKAASEKAKADKSRAKDKAKDKDKDKEKEKESKEKES